jgi:hypothetical protein
MMNDVHNVTPVVHHEFRCVHCRGFQQGAKPLASARCPDCGDVRHVCCEGGEAGLALARIAVRVHKLTHRAPRKRLDTSHAFWHN